MSEQIQSIILDELRALRTRFDVYSDDMGQRTTRLETHMESLVGDKQPGRLTRLEDKVAAIQQWRHYTTGIYIGVSGIVSAATAFIYHLWK
jgi:hypothetical protein